MEMVRSIALLFGLLALVLGTAAPCGADPFSVSGNWNYRENGGDATDTLTNFSQSYNLNFAKQLSSMMDFSSAVRYNESQASEGQDSNSLNPSASFNLRNDFFSLSLSGTENRTESEGSVPLINKTWGANVYSQLEKWPGLRLSYNQSSTLDDQSNHTQNSESTSLGASVDYSLAAFDLLYDFRTGTSEDLVADSTSDTLNHYAQLKYSESFFRNRLSVSASQQYSSNQTETDTPVGPGGIYVQPVLILEAYSAVSTNPLLGSLPTNFLLDNDDRTTSAGVEIATNPITDYQNIGVRVESRPVSRVQLYLSELILSSALLPLNWELYRSTDNELWTPVGQTLTVSFTTVAGRTLVSLDLPIPVLAPYLKVVVNAVPPQFSPVYVAEIEAGELRTTDAARVLSKTKFVSHQTQLSLSYRPAPGWSTGYSMRRVLNLPDSGLENTQISHSLNASYAPSAYFTVALGASESSNQLEGEDASRSRSYSLAFNSSPLPVLDLSLGYTRTHSYEGGTEMSQSDLINANLAAELFPDLTLGFSPSWSRSRALDSGGETTSYGYSLTSTARLTPRLTLTASWNYAHSETDTNAPVTAESVAAASTSTRYGATLSYRPSDVLLLSGNLSQDLDADSTAMGGNLSCLLTRELQINVGAAFTSGEQDTERYNTSLTWSISRNLSLQGSGGYQIADSGDTWNFSTSLNANY